MKQRALPTVTQEISDSRWDYIRTHQKLCHTLRSQSSYLIITERLIHPVYVRESMPIVLADTHMLLGLGEPALNTCSAAG